MELLTPGTGILLWQILMFINFVLLVISFLWIMKSTALSTTHKVILLILSFLIPFVGPLLALAFWRRSKVSNRRA